MIYVIQTFANGFIGNLHDSGRARLNRERAGVFPLRQLFQ
jgi:hypothetical protein